MKLLSVLLLAIMSLVLFNQSEAWPVAKAEVINVSEHEFVPWLVLFPQSLGSRMLALNQVNSTEKF